jgi:hypothetical protein
LSANRAKTLICGKPGCVKGDIMPIDTPSAESKKELVEQLKALLLQAQSGELTGFMCLTVNQTTGQRELHVTGDYCAE